MDQGGAGTPPAVPASRPGVRGCPHLYLHFATSTDHLQKSKVGLLDQIATFSIPRKSLTSSLACLDRLDGLGNFELKYLLRCEIDDILRL